MLPAMQLANNDVQQSSNYYHHPRLPPLPRIHVIQPSVQFDTRYAGRNKIGLGTGDPEPRIYFSQINALFNKLVNNLRPRQSVTVTITNFISRNNLLKLVIRRSYFKLVHIVERRDQECYGGWHHIHFLHHELHTESFHVFNLPGPPFQPQLKYVLIDVSALLFISLQAIIIYCFKNVLVL